MKFLFMALFMLGLVACDKTSSTDSATERAKAEEKGTQEAQAEKAKGMEADLKERHAFYDALEGEYVGSVRVEDETYKVKFTLKRSRPPYKGERVRQLSEIENEINNLVLNIQVVQWHPSDEATAVGCPVIGVMPNMSDGTWVLASADCPNLYEMFLDGDIDGQRASDKAKIIAAGIQSGNISNVGRLSGSIQPSSVARKYSFSASKVQQ